MDLQDKGNWMALALVQISLKGLSKKLVKKCKGAARTLEWGEKERYFENSSTLLATAAFVQGFF